MQHGVGYVRVQRQRSCQALLRAGSLDDELGRSRRDLELRGIAPTIVQFLAGRRGEPRDDLESVPCQQGRRALRLRRSFVDPLGLLRDREANDLVRVGLDHEQQRIIAFSA